MGGLEGPFSVGERVFPLENDISTPGSRGSDHTASLNLRYQEFGKVRNMDKRQHQHCLSAYFVYLSWGKERRSNASDASDVDVPSSNPSSSVRKTQKTGIITKIHSVRPGSHATTRRVRGVLQNDSQRERCPSEHATTRRGRGVLQKL
jgi:hypothetical protein